MAIKLWWNTNITLTNTSFVGDVYPGKKSVPLFTAASNWTYYFEWDLQDSGTIAVSLNINSTPKEIWTYYDSVSHHVSYEFTLVTWDVVEIEVSWYWTGSNLTVTRYADDPKEIFVWEWTLVDDYSAMRWPCPEGFHVPLQTEFETLNTILEWLWYTTTNDKSTAMVTYLKMPMAWNLYWSSGNKLWVGDNWQYWSAKKESSSDGHAYALYFSWNSFSKQLSKYTSSGASIRPFRDEPVTPDNTWTIEYQWTWNAGIYSNATLWLISISSDGTNWITILNKNLWATTVYNNWDTLTESNCWKYYQRWNNYWFPFTWPVTISTTQVDVTDYWPWNYYSSDTFICWNQSNQNWFNVINRDRNLRWWVTWVQQKHIWNVTEVYVGTTKVRPSGWTYSYTFKWKTAAEIWNEFGVLVGGIYTNSNWLTWGTNTECRIKKDIPSLANAKRIIISGTIVGQNLNTTAGEIWIWKWSWWGTWEVSYQVFWSSYNGMKTYLGYNNTNNYWNSVGNATAQTYKPTLTIDLTNKTIVWSVSWFSNSTMSLTDAQVADIRTYEYIVCYVSLGTSTISDVSITIE
jgi:hypothetical protein